MATQPPATSPAPRVVTQAYPGVNAVKDTYAQIALRLLHDLLGLVKVGSIPTRGTLDPDQKPVLNPLQAGYLFWASDYDRVFKWDGSAWGDAPGQPTRGQVAFFQGAPGLGWARCSGTQTQTTQSNASLQALTTPTVDPVNGLLAWIRL